MNKKLWILLGIIVVGIFILPYTMNAQTDEQIQKIKVVQTCEAQNQTANPDENITNRIYCFQFTFTIIGSNSSTYTYNSMEYINVAYDFSKPKKLNDTLLQSVIDYTQKKYNFTLSGRKIFYHPYEQGYNP